MTLLMPWSSSVLSFHVTTTTNLHHPHHHVRTTHHRGPPPLFYRELEEDDDDATMLQVQSKTPVGYDMRQALQEQKQEQEQQQQAALSSRRIPKNALNLPLIRALLLNQVLIVTLASIVFSGVLFFNGGISAFGHLNEILHWSTTTTAANAAPSIWDLQLTSTRLVQGLMGAIPMLALGNAVESSDKRVFANVNFSTIVMTLTLFGRRRAPPQDFVPDKYKGKRVLTTSSFDALLQSFALSSLTGICEETVFRAQLPALLVNVLHFNIPLAVVAQALLFGLGHAQPNNSNRIENAILIGLQFCNGITLAMVYILCGGDIVPCMVAHALYDLVTFFKTWWDANGQLEYAEQMFLQPLPPEVETEVRRVLAANRNNLQQLDPMTMKVIKRLFYIFDFDQNQTLSKSEVRKGISYMSLEKAGRPPPPEIVDQAFELVVNTRDNSIVQERDRNRLSFSDFIRLYTTMYNIKSNTSSGAVPQQPQKQKQGAK